jgi:hypothetical protein
MRRFPTDRDIMEHVVKIDCRRKNNCKSQCEQYCRRCVHNRNGSKMQDYYIPRIADLKYL